MPVHFSAFFNSASRTESKSIAPDTSTDRVTSDRDGKLYRVVLRSAILANSCVIEMYAKLNKVTHLSIGLLPSLSRSDVLDRNRISAVA